jgi:hypothetical protein
MSQPAVRPDERRERDDALLAELTAPPSLEEAEESYRYWLNRRDELPRRKRRERLEAEHMAERWKQRLHDAERERYGPGLIEQVLDALGMRWRPDVHRIARRLGILAILVLLVMVAAIVAVIVFWSDLQPIIHTFTGAGGGGEGGG